MVIYKDHEENYLRSEIIDLLELRKYGEIPLFINLIGHVFIFFATTKVMHCYRHISDLDQ